MANPANVQSSFVFRNASKEEGDSDCDHVEYVTEPAVALENISQTKQTTDGGSDFKEQDASPEYEQALVNRGTISKKTSLVSSSIYNSGPMQNIPSRPIIGR